VTDGLIGPSTHEGTVRGNGERFKIKCDCGWESRPMPTEARAWYEFDTHQASGDW
jgi:hypothetical protein